MSDTIDSIANGIRYAVRQLGDDMPYIVMARQMRSLADDIVAAHKREIDKLKEQIEDLRQQCDVWSKRADELKMNCDEHYAKLKQVGDAAHKREADSIHRAMVILAGIEMPDHDYPPKLWTALEDAYDALSDAVGTDGETTSDIEEAKSIGRHFVIQPHGDAAKLREACAKAAESAAEIMERVRHKDGLAFNTANYIVGVAKDALAEPSRNCDVGTPREQNERFVSFCASHYRGAEAMKTDDGPCDCPCWVKGQGCNCFVWAQMPYEEGGAK